MTFIYQRTISLLLFILIYQGLSAQRKMEKLSRGIVATRTATSKVLVSWRLLGTEAQDIGFNIYRSENGGTFTKLNSTELTAGTNFEDTSPNLTVPNTYTVKPVINSIEKEAEGSFTLPANTAINAYYKIPIRKIDGYVVGHIFPGDIDGDGEFDFVLHKLPDATVSGSQNLPGLVEAYKRDGTLLWTINMGVNSLNRNNVTPGSSALECGHGDNWTVYDINNDGKAEVVLRTSNGVTFADNSMVSDSDNSRQYISIINGQTGVEISRTLINNPYLSRGPLNGHMGIAYLDGINPSVILMGANRNADSSFNEFITAWDWTGSTLQTKWVFDLTGKKIPSGHQIKIFDIDGDGKDEIFPQAFAIDDDGTLMYNLLDQAIDHGDRFAISDLDPLRPGLELYGVQQGNSQLGILWYYCDAKTGKLLASKSDPSNIDVGAGMVVDVDPRYIGLEMQAFRENFYNLLGNEISTARPSVTPSQRLWWDGDIAGEILSDNGKIVKWNPLINKDTRLYTAITTAGAVESSVPSFYGDIIGDWREEVIYETTDHNNLVVLTSPNFTTIRLYTMPHNPGYRNDMCLKGYYQSNNPDYFVGYDMQQPPLPPIQNATEYWVGNTSTWDKTLSNWSDGINVKTFADGDTIMFDIRGINRDTIKLNIDASPARIWVMNPEGKDYIVSGTGKLTGAMDLWKAKGGNFTIGGNHDYTGQTYVTEGQLNIDGSVKSKLIVKGLGAIGGRGKLLGGLALDKGVNIKGGRISPGFGLTNARLGTLTVSGNLALNENNIEFDIVPGSPRVNDSLVVAGDLIITGSNKLIINFANDNFAPGTYTLIKTLGTLTASINNFTIQGVAGVAKELMIENNELKLKIATVRAPGQVVWNGSSNNSWNFENKNFLLNLEQTAFVAKDTVSFTNTASQKLVILNETVFPSSVTFNSDADYTLQGTGSISGITGIIKNNTGAFNILSTNNTYTGKTILNGGKVTIASLNKKNEPSSIGSGSLSADNIQVNNTNLVIINKSITDRPVTITGATTITIPDASSYTIFSADVSGSGSLVKDGEGSIYMVGAKTFTGPVIIKSGGINLRAVEGNNNGLGTSRSITIENGTLSMDELESYSAPEWNLIVPADKNATFNVHGRTNMRGTLTGAGTLTINIPYIRSGFSGNWSAFTGKLNINDNEFRIANSFGYGNSAINIVLGTVRAISGAGSSISIGELSGGSGTALASDNSTANWTIGSKNTDVMFSGNITKSALTKVGMGTFTVDGNNTYAGNTAINAGRLLVNNAAGKRGIGAGSVVVASGAILGGTGGIKGAVAVNTGGSVQPGSNGIGTLTDSTNVTFASGSIAEMEINKSVASTTFDVLKVTGGLTFNGKLLIGKLGTTAFAPGDNFKLFEATSYTGNFASIEPQAPGPNLTWQFTPATGTLSVVGTATPQTITFSPIGNKFVGDTDFNPGATASSGLPVTYTSSDPTVATIVNGHVHIISAGSTTITASQGGDATYLAATPVNQVLSVNKKTQTITFTALPQKVRGDADFGLSATSTSGLTIGYSSSNSAVATVTNGVVHIIGTGSTTITASQEGDAMYLAATPVPQVLTVTKKSQNITFSTLPQKMTGDEDFTLSATSTSGLPVSFISSNTAVATVTNSLVHIVGAGSTTITASQAGDAMYNVATTFEQTLVVVPAPLIVFTLPGKNFKISATDETCASSNNGKIRIEATAAFNYKVKVNGSGTEYSLTSSAPLELSNLSAGNYEVCITVDGQANYKFCAPQVRITEPAALSVYSSVNTADKIVYLSLSGGNSYEVELNGQIYKTGSNTFTLNLAEGKNDLVVRTDKECQGIFTKSLILDSKKLIYPNPFNGTLFINFGDDLSKTAKLSIFSLTGSEVYSKEHVLGSGDIELNLSSLAPGTYILKIKTAQSENSSQIIKK